MKSSALVIFIFACLAVAQEDRGIYKTCLDSSFCRRLRNVVAGSSKYAVLPETLYTDSTSVTLEIKHTESNHLFLLKLSALQVCCVMESSRMKLSNRDFRQ